VLKTHYYAEDIATAKAAFISAVMASSSTVFFAGYAYASSLSTYPVSFFTKLSQSGFDQSAQGQLEINSSFIPFQPMIAHYPGAEVYVSTIVVSSTYFYTLTGSFIVATTTSGVEIAKKQIVNNSSQSSTKSMSKLHELVCTVNCDHIIELFTMTDSTERIVVYSKNLAAITNTYVMQKDMNNGLAFTDNTEISRPFTYRRLRMLYGTDSAYIFLKPENNFRHFTGTTVLKRIVLLKYNFASPGTTSVYENESQDGVFSAFQEYSNSLF